MVECQPYLKARTNISEIAYTIELQRKEQSRRSSSQELNAGSPE